MLYKNIKHASSADIEILNDIKDIKFQNNEKYFIIAKKDLLLTSKNDDRTRIFGSNIKLKKYKCYFRSDLEKNIRKYVKLHF
jgi:hypothetical protein